MSCYLGPEYAYSKNGSISGDSNYYDGVEYHDNVDVGCILTLVEKAAMKNSNSESEAYTDSEYYSTEVFFINFNKLINLV